jgi:aspartyl-tRNA(Asn)/glutamyl-tRNA(Gln) amidotransferase subunit B
MRSAAEAVAYAKKLHELVQWIGICDGNMQEGSFRCDVNVSVRPKGTTELGTRREIKNLNSFKFMQQAIAYETQWQIDTLEDGGKIQQATVLFNPDTGETRAMRNKEEANDYRYFPDPDLLPLEITEADKAAVKAEMSELPAAMKARFESAYALSPYDASSLTASKNIADYFERVIHAGGDAKLAANWVMGGISAKLNAEDKSIAESPIAADLLAQLIKRIADNTISNNAAKQVFEAMWSGESDVDAIIEAKGLKQVSDTGAIEAIINDVLGANQAMVEEYKAGKEKAFNALVGQIMKASKGKANPAQVNIMLKEKLSN